MKNAALPMIDESELFHREDRDEAGFGALETSEGVLPLRKMDIHCGIMGLAYNLTLVQTFVNAFDRPWKPRIFSRFQAGRPYRRSGSNSRAA